MLAALDGAEALEAQLREGTAERFVPVSPDAEAKDPVGAYLRAVTVAGFRGIGAPSTLTVNPGPGLTLVVGRNGSGKSSFAEGLEVLLTGGLMRWNSAPMVVKEGWRSRHVAGDPEVTAEFYVEGKGKTVVSRSWPAAAGTDIGKSDAWVQVNGEKQRPIQALGWDAALVEYRPFLSHAELEAFFGTPSELHDLLASVLGLEDLNAADKRLQAAAKFRTDELTRARKTLDELRPRLAALAEHDERAVACLKALPGTNPARWDIQAARAVATGRRGQPGDEGQIAQLRSLANLTTPTTADVAEAVQTLRDAAARIASLAGSDAEQARDLVALLNDDQWSPIAAELAAWCEAAAGARTGALPVDALKAARQWLVKATAELRDQRIAPLADESRSIWADLRQESNVDLGEFRLTGTNTRRQLDLNVTIDGEPGSALGVMSQGEINALALSIFLPRATIPASPFRFLVIDDPVQAMDPAKVDGLAKVLDKVAKQRQVIVFTHDNRLASAIRDLSIPAAVWEVKRQPRSNVTVEKCRDASEQALKDARSLNKDPNIPTEVARRVIPGLCRTAVEAAFTEAYWRTQLRSGRTRSEIEKTLEGKTLNMRAVAMLAFFGDAKGNVAGQLHGQWGPAYAETYKALNRGAHEGHPGDLAELIDDAEAFVSKIAEKLP